MNFIGQEHIMAQLRFMLPELLNTGVSANFLLEGKSGFGKTKMAVQICNYLSGLDYQYADGERFVLNPSKRVHLIDEAHELRSFESMYPIMDSGKYVFVFTTNIQGKLPEAFVNRCERFIFVDYSEIELMDMISEWSTIEFSDEQLHYLITTFGGNPRELNHIVRKLEMLWRNTGIDFGDLDRFKHILLTIFGIEDGLDILARRYVDILHSLGGTAGLHTIKSMLHTDEQTIRYMIEPVLLYQNKLVITNKGRSLI